MQKLTLAGLLLATASSLTAQASTGYLVDSVSFAGATPTRGDVASTVSAAYSLVALRTARRSLAGSLTLYSNSTPDTAVTRTATSRLSCQIPISAALDGLVVNLPARQT